MSLSNSRERQSLFSGSTIIVAVILSIALGVGAVIPYLSDSFSLKAIALVLTGVIALVLLVPFLKLVVTNERIVQPLSVYVFVAFGYVANSVYLLLGGQSNMSYIVNQDQLPSYIFALFCVLVGVFSFILIYNMASNTNRGTFELSPPTSQYFVSPRRLKRVVWLFAIIGTAGYLLNLYSAGGLRFLLANIVLRGQLANSYALSLSVFLPSATWIWYVYDKKAYKQPLFRALITLCVLFLISRGARAPLMFFILVFAIVILLRSKKDRIVYIRLWWKNAPKLAFLIFVFLFIFFSFLSWRQLSYSEQANALTVNNIREQMAYNVQDDVLLESFLGRANLANMQMTFLIVANVPGHSPLLLGRSFAWAALAFVPRSLWPAKPVSLGLYLTRKFINSATITGVPPSFIGELFLNFHLFGVIVGCALLGLFTAKVYNRFNRYQDHPTVMLLFALFLVYFVATIVKADFRIAVSQYIFPAMSVLLAHYLIRPVPFRDQDAPPKMLK